MQVFDQPKKPLSVKLMGFLGFRHVPDNHVQVIARHGRYHRAVEGPFVRRRFLSETFGPQMRVGIRVVDQTYQNIISRDGNAHHIGVSVKVFFDLQKAEAFMATLVVQNGEQMIYNRVASLTELALRREVGRLDSTKLLQPEIPVLLEKAIEKRLGKLSNMGISLLQIEDGIVVKEILAPDRMRENRTEATNIEETISTFERLQGERVKQALLAHLLRDVGKQRPMFKAMNLPEDLSAADDDVLDASFRVLRGPTGRIYDN